MNKKIIFAAGGTGGHIFPAINLMKHFYHQGCKVVLVTDKRGKNFIEDYSEFKTYILKADTPTNKKFLEKILSFFVIFYSLFRSILILRNEKPNLVIGFGGYVSFPISYASKFFKLPLVIYENNLVLGRTNKYLLPMAKKVFIAKKIVKNFPEKFKNKIYEVGSILDKNIINYSNLTNYDNKENFTILALGGSQGAEIFGKILPSITKMIKEEGHKIEIYQQCVKNQKKLLIDYYKKNNIKNYVFEFEKNILKLILSSDIAITRCGASSTAELAYTCTPFIAVPLSNSIDNHQYLNAKFYEEKGHCWILEEKNFNTKNLFNLITEVIKNKNKLKKIRDSMRKNLNNNVYIDIENQIKEFI